jgi:hypothetical protein
MMLGEGNMMAWCCMAAVGNGMATACMPSPFGMSVGMNVRQYENKKQQ